MAANSARRAGHLLPTSAAPRFLDTPARCLLRACSWSLALGGFVLLGVAGSAIAADSAGDSGLTEIVVTAQKYNSTIQDTPISISALSGAQLVAAGITTVEEMSHEVPGLSMRSAGPGQTEYEARGLASNGGAAPTVGFYLDEVPLSPPALAQVGKVVIDPDLYDVNRIELLRGPQGTLYGSGSMGGTIKVVTNEPKLGAFEGSVQGTLSDTQGGGANGGGKFMLNVPIGDTLALRVVGTDEHRSGWIDRVVLNPFPLDTPLANGPPYVRGNVLAAPVQNAYHDVNTEDLYGGRASILFQPSSDLSIVGTVLYQRLTMGGYDEFDYPPGSSYEAHFEAANVPEPMADTVHIYSLKIEANLGFAQLTSATAYWDRQEHQTQDATESTSQFTGVVPYVGAPWSEIDLTRQFSQEVRLTSHEDGRLRWVAGAFFSDLNSVWQLYSANSFYAAPGNETGLLGAANNPYRVQQFAAFADGSYKLTDTLTFSAGLRWYRYLSQQLEQEWGDFINGSDTPPTATKTEAADNGFNPRFNLSYSPNANLNTYISASKGFRPGGANQIVPPPNVPPYCAAGAPLTFGPDSVWNYEIGEKAKAFDNWLTINSDFYYIKWNDVQETLLLACGSEYNANAGSGRSFGPELEINAKLSSEWSISLSASYTDAKITNPSAQYIGNVLGSVSSCQSAGSCVLPVLNVPKDAGSIALIYTTRMMDYEFTARIADTYVGSSYDESFVFGIPLPSYSIANARFTLSRDQWSANLFVNNLTNKVAEISANNTSFQVNIPELVRYSTNQPRTVGAQINYRF
jgi:outer membrane receptor protein involved in Fe transport